MKKENIDEEEKLQEKKQNTKKKKKRAFTLIELLAVIIILGVLMIIAIPSVTKYIQDSRKNAYVTTAQNFIDSARVMANSGELPMYDPETTYYIPKECISLEKGGDSPYGEFKDAYVVVTYKGDGYDYYWTSTDETNNGIYLTYEGLLNADSVISGVSSVNTNIAIDTHNNISLLDKTSCSTFSEPSGSIYQIDEQKALTSEDNEEADKYALIYINNKSYSFLKDKTWNDLKSGSDIGNHGGTSINGTRHSYHYVPNNTSVSFCIDATSSNNGVAGGVYMSRNGITGSVTGGSWFGGCVYPINSDIAVNYSYALRIVKKPVDTGEFRGLVYTCIEPLYNSSNAKVSASSKLVPNEHYHTNHECDNFELIDLVFEN